MTASADPGFSRINPTIVSADSDGQRILVSIPSAPCKGIHPISWRSAYVNIVTCTSSAVGSAVDTHLGDQCPVS